MKPFRWTFAFLALVLFIAAPRQAPANPADADLDCDVDMADARAFFDCFDGLECTTDPASYDFDADGLVDLDDYALFYSCFNGPNEPVPETCGLAFAVVANGPATLEDGQSGQLTATADFAVGEVDYLWSVVAGDAILDDPTAQNPTIWINGTSDVIARVVASDPGGPGGGPRYALDEWVIDVIPETVPSYRVFAGDDHAVELADPTVIELNGSFFDPAGCFEHQNLFEWTLVIAPEDADGWFDNPYRLGSTYPVHFTLDFDIEGEYLFELYGYSVCSADFDTDTISIYVGTPPLPFNVTLICPQTMEWDATVGLTAAVVGATGSLTYQWEATEGDITGTGATVSLTSTSVDDSEVTVTVTDNMGTPSFPVDDVLVSDTCTITKFVNPVACDVGEDRIFLHDLAEEEPLGFDFTDYVFSYGNDLGDGQNTIPEVITGHATDAGGPPEQLRLSWSVSTVPEDMDPADVIITSSTTAPPLDLDFIIVPDVFASADRIGPDGMLGDTLHDIVAPGTYTFTLDVWRQDFTASDSCDLDVTIGDGFKIDPNDLPALNGTAPGNGTPTHLTTSLASKTIDMMVYSTLPGTLEWLLQDTSLASDYVPDQDVSTSGVAGTPNLIAAPVNLSMSTGGTFNLNANFIGLDPEATVLADPEKPTAVVAHFQPDVFQVLGPVTTPTLDSRDLAPDEDVDFATDLPHYGQVSSTEAPDGGEKEYTFHGAHAGAAALNFDGPRVRTCDYNCDGVMDVLLLDDDNRYIHVCNSLASDPQPDGDGGYDAPINNSINNDGTIDADFERFTITLGATGLTTDFACGDLNNDGFPDLIVGDALFDEGTVTYSLEGRVRVYYHNGQCTFGSSPWPTANATFIRADSGSASIDFLFGWRLAVADFNGDNIDDVIVSAPGDDGMGSLAGHTKSGRVYVLPGKPAQYSGTTVINDNPGALGVPGAVVIGEFTGSADGDLFGLSLDAADVDSDGLADLVIGAPGFTGTGAGTPQDAGAVYLVLGIATGTEITDDGYDTRYEGNQAGLGLGRQVLCCDYNGNGTVDYAVSAYQAVAGALDPLVNDIRGRIFVLLDDPLGFDSDAIALDTLFPQVLGDNTNSNLGPVLAAADWNGDGFDDLLTTAASSGGAPVLDDQKAFLFNGEAAPALLMDPSLTILDGSGDNWLDCIQSSALVYGTVRTTGTQLIGTGTQFLVELWAGALVRAEGGTQVRQIASVTNNTTATLDAAFVPDLPAGTTLHVVKAMPMNGPAQQALRGNLNWIGFVDFNGDGVKDLAFSESLSTNDLSVVYGVDDE